eukprot:4299396-Amphidinium_carterae.1
MTDVLANILIAWMTKFRMVAVRQRRQGPQHKERQGAEQESLLLSHYQWEYYDLVNIIYERRLHQHAFCSKTTSTQERTTGTAVRQYSKATNRMNKFRTTRSYYYIQELGSRSTNLHVTRRPQSCEYPGRHQDGEGSDYGCELH